MPGQRKPEIKAVLLVLEDGRRIKLGPSEIRKVELSGAMGEPLEMILYLISVELATAMEPTAELPKPTRFLEEPTKVIEAKIDKIWE